MLKSDMIVFYDDSEGDRLLTGEVCSFLAGREGPVRLYGAGRFCRYLLRLAPEVGNHVASIIDDNPALGGSDIGGVPVVPLREAGGGGTIFLCTTQAGVAGKMRAALEGGSAAVCDIGDVAPGGDSWRNDRLLKDAIALHREGRFDLAAKYYSILRFMPEAGENLDALAARRFPVESHFLMNLCLKYDFSASDRNCAGALFDCLKSLPGETGFAGKGRMMDYLFELRPELGSLGPVLDLEGGVPAGRPPPNVFICETRFSGVRRLGRMLREAMPGANILTLDLLSKAAPEAIPAHAMRRISTIYPIEIPEARVRKGLDMLLLDLPKRMMAQMPNGLAYVHEALKRTGANFQTLDLDIVFYHIFHSERVLDGGEGVATPSGYIVRADPWHSSSVGEWGRPEVQEYFDSELGSVIDKIVEAAPRIVGLSIHGENRMMADKVVSRLRERMPELTIIVGGYDFLFYETARRRFRPEYDHLFVGECEETLPVVMGALLRGERPADIPGVISKRDTPGRLWREAAPPSNLDDVRFPLYDWVDDIRIYRNHDGYWLAPVLSSRGCRWSKCNFCGERVFWRKRAPSNVADEIEWLMDKGVKLITFNDSDVNGDPENLAAICDEITRRGLHPQMSGQLRISKKNTREFFEKLSRAGLTNLRFGVDGWTDNLLRRERKGYDMRMVEENLRNCTEGGILPTVNIVVGIPGETDEDIDETIRNFVRLKPYFSVIDNIHKLLLIANSPFYIEPEKYGIKFKGDKARLYDEFYACIPDDQWYSEDPFMDAGVRHAHFARFLKGLRENAIPFGGFADAMVRKILEG